MAISSAIMEELIEDTRDITARVIRWGDRWSTIGDQIGHNASESQLAEIDAVIKEFIAVVRGIGGEV